MLRAFGIAALVVALALIGASSASAEEVVTRSFYAQEEAFLVPAGVSSIEVVAVGGHGGSNARGVPGGQGARVSGSLSVTPGETLYVHVGGSGVSGSVPGSAGEGGKASDVRLLPLSAGLVPDIRLIVAGAGGGAGGQPPTGIFSGSEGGNAEQEAGETLLASGGEGGTQIAGGEGGSGDCGVGERGMLERGGEGAECTMNSGLHLLAGSGGDGLYGGGGGGTGSGVSSLKDGEPGGGGGSSLVPTGGTKAFAGTERPQVRISYVQPPNPPAVTTTSASGVVEAAATLNGTVNPEDAEVSACFFEYGETEAYGQTAGCASVPGPGLAPAGVSAQVSGLSAQTTYHYRLVAYNTNGTSYGGDRTFTTLLHNPPTLTAVSPQAGIATGGTAVTITGEEFYEVTAVKFGAHEAAGFTVNSPESITAVSPAGTGTVQITVSTPYGTTPATSASSFAFVRQPVVTQISPTGGSEGGGTTVAIAGSGFTNASTVSFGGNTATSYTVNSDTSITAVSPPGAGTVDVTVTVPVGGTSATSSADRFLYFNPAAPEYGRCIKVTAGTGKFSNSSCTALGGEKKYEWYGAFGSGKPLLKTHFTTKNKELTEAKLQTSGGKLIACRGETGAGEYSGPKAVANVTLRLTGCHLGEATSCQSGAAGEGEILSAVLTGQLGVIKTSTEGAAKNLIGTDLRPSPGEPFASFTCGLVPVTLTGSVIAEVKRNSTSTLGLWKFVSSSKGIQKPTRFEGGEEEVLSAVFGEAPAERAGLSLTAVQTSEEKVEANSVY